MGFYHYLKVEDENKEIHDVGGYSKGGSLKHWFFAFEPQEYYNNLEKVVKENNPHMINVGYKTTVKEAIKRLEKASRRLHQVRDNLRMHSKEREFGMLDYKIHPLVMRLKYFSPSSELILNQSEGCEYRLKWDGDNVVGLEDFWYSNEAEENEECLKSFETENVKLGVAIEDFLETLPNEEIPNLFQEMIWYIAEEERSYGPNPVSMQFDEYHQKEREKNNNPRELFKMVMDALIKDYEKEKKEEQEDELDFGYSITERDLNSYLHIAYDYITGTMEELQKMSR